VSVASDTRSAERSVTLEPGATVSVVFSLPRAAAPAAGWVTVQAPFDVQIRENDSVVATGRNAKIMLPAGTHALTLANDSLQYEDSRRIDIEGGKTTALRIDAPKVAVSINARPWAEVLVDGATLGQTPIANAAVAVGTHDIVFRHPQLGERRRTIVVTARGPNRVTVDLTK
jgi:hypothetical protein